MILSTFFSVICLLSGQIGIEATGGMTLPGSPESDTPALDLDLRLKTGVAPCWSVFLSASFWKSKNFHPTAGIPAFTGTNPLFGYDVYGEYSDSHRGIQLGAERMLGPVSLDAAGGWYSRTIMLYMPGVGKKRYGEENYTESGLLASFAMGIPAGRFGILRVGTRTEGFEDWFLTLSAGIGFTFSYPRGGSE